MTLTARNCGPMYDVAQLSSLFTVCAVALDGADNFSEDVAKGVRESVMHILEWGAVLASDICGEVEKLEYKSDAPLKEAAE